MTYKKKDAFAEKIVYFSHPVFSHRTKTERRCMKMLKELNPKEVINPANLGLRHDIREQIHRADAVVGMAVSGKFTYVVWKELELGKERGAEVFTLMVENKNDLGPLVEGIPKDIVKLSQEDSKEFVECMIASDLRESVLSLFIGNLGRRF